MGGMGKSRWSPTALFLRLLQQMKATSRKRTMAIQPTITPTMRPTLAGRDQRSIITFLIKAVKMKNQPRHSLYSLTARSKKTLSSFRQPHSWYLLPLNLHDLRCRLGRNRICNQLGQISRPQRNSIPCFLIFRFHPAITLSTLLSLYLP